MSEISKAYKTFGSVILITALFLLHMACEFDRTTHVYGKVVDQAHQPVDSIMVLMTVSNLSSKIVNLASTYTDENGKYEILVEVPKKYLYVQIGIPYYPLENPKFQNYIMVEQTGNSASPLIGKKTEWNFKLEHK